MAVINTNVQSLTAQRNLNTSQSSLATSMQQADPDIEYAEPDRRMYAQWAPSDPDYWQQWHYHEPTGGINLPAAWDRSTGNGVRVAVIDTERGSASKYAGIFAFERAGGDAGDPDQARRTPVRDSDVIGAGRRAHRAGEHVHR